MVVELVIMEGMELATTRRKQVSFACMLITNISKPISQGKHKWSREKNERAALVIKNEKRN